jgi:hypothetical protein
MADFSGDEALKFAVREAKNVRTGFLGDQIMSLLLKGPLISGYPTPNKLENNKPFNLHALPVDLQIIVISMDFVCDVFI